MRVVQVVENLEIGGLERLAVDLAKEQRKQGHEPAIYCLFSVGELAQEAEASGVPVHSFGKRRGLSVGALWEMAWRLRQERPDVVHTNNAGVHHYGVAAARLAAVPVAVNTRHGLGTVPANPRNERKFHSCLPWTDAVVLVSQDALEFFIRERRIPRQKARLILNGIPVEKFSARRAHPDSKEAQMRFGTVGRLVPAKDHHTMIEAFALLVKRFPQAELHLLGDGPLRGEIEGDVARLGLQHSVSLHGSRLDVAEFLSTLGVFVLSSVTEGLPVVILEAMAAGLPIVSTHVGGVPEVAPEGEVATYCPPNSPSLLADAMCQTANSPDRAARGEMAFRLARERFGISEMWCQYERLFQELLARHRNQGTAGETVEDSPDWPKRD